MTDDMTRKASPLPKPIEDAITELECTVFEQIEPGDPNREVAKARAVLRAAIVAMMRGETT